MSGIQQVQDKGPCSPGADTVPGEGLGRGLTPTGMYCQVVINATEKCKVGCTFCQGVREGVSEEVLFALKT